MQKSNAPALYVIPWANSGTKNTIPVSSQIGITNGAASFTDGYPPLTFTPIASGGVPPFGADTNGILYDETINTLWQQSGFLYTFNSTFSTNQGGYPAQALLSRSDGKGFWLNLTDNNTTNPDNASPSGWASVRANLGSTSIAVVNGNNTPDVSLLGPRLLVITGSISSTASLILPLTSGSSWVIQNSTSGAGSLSVQGVTGTGVTVAQGTVSEVITDGTNFYTSTFNGSGVYLPINGTAVAATKLATARTIAMTGDVLWTSPAFDGTSNVTASGAIANGAVTLSKMATFQANSLMGNPTGSTATPSAITLTNGILFSGTALGLGNITPTGISSSGIIGAFIGSVASQQALYRYGWNNGIARWAAAIETDASYSLYSYDSSGASIGRPLNLAQSGALSVGPTTVTGDLGVTGAVNANNYLGSFTGSVSSQQVVGRFGWSNGVTRISQVIESNASYSLYSYNSSGAALANIFKVDPSGNATFAGSITATTGNFTSSDARLKYQIDKTANPRPLHRNIPWAKYIWIESNDPGIGPIAQDVADEESLYTSEYVKDGSSFMAIDKASIALEQSFWCGREADSINSRLKSVELFLAEKMRY